jgi:uncharacterized protein DUF3467
MTGPRTIAAARRAAQSVSGAGGTCVSTEGYGSEMDDESPERQLNIHVDPQHLAGAYANFATVSFSDYEFTITFARVDHEVDDAEVPGVVVSRVNLSAKFMRELMDAIEDSWSKWTTREGIRNLPEP